MGRKNAAKIEVDDRYVTLESVKEILCVSDGHVYMLEKYGHIQSIDISCNGTGGPRTKRYSMQSIKDFIEKRKIDPDSIDITDDGENL